MPPVADRQALTRSDRLGLLGLVAIVGYAIHHRSIDLDPVSLWLDDCWVAVLSASPLDLLLAYGSSSPPLFNLIIAASLRLIPDPELGAQAFPFIASLLAIPATALAAWLITRRWTCTLFAAAIIACHPFASEFATRVKQYSSDTLIAALHVAGFTLLTTGYTRRRLWTYTAFACVGLYLSTMTLLILAALLPPLLWELHGRQRLRDPHPAVASAAIGLAAAGLYFGFILPGVNPALSDYWRAAYLSSESVGELASGIGALSAAWLGDALHGRGVHVGPLPGAALIGLALGASGCTYFAIRRMWSHLAGFSFLGAGVFVASALEQLPLGSGRVELFLLPFLAVLLACGLATVSLAPAATVRRAWPFVALGLTLAQLHHPREPRYVAEHAAPLVERVRAEKRDGDTLLVNLHSTFPLAYYGPWEIDLVPEASLGTGFYPMVRAPNTRVLIMGRAIRPVDTERVLSFACTAPSAYQGLVDAVLRAGGYELEAWAEEPGCTLTIYRRPPTPTEQP